MPELPEVETLRRGLEQAAIPGRQITRVIIANSKTLIGQSETRFQERVLGTTVGAVKRRGKYLLMPLVQLPTPSYPPPVASGALACLCIHLKMRGQLLVEGNKSAPGKYHCVTLGLDDGRDLRFYDMWTWGEMRALTNDELEALPNLAGMGREPLDAHWGALDLAQTLAGRKTPIKPALLDQRVLAGVGNIYADEALFRAGIHPERQAMSLSGLELERLANAVRTILLEAVNGGGTTSDNYVDVRGVAGRYTPRVYDRGGQPCLDCGTLLRRIRIAGRGTVFCGNCQT